MSAVIRAVLVLFLLTRAGEAQTKPAVEPQAPVPALVRADFKVAVWYRRDRPLETFQYQIYDVRKGQYSTAVDDWLALMQSKYKGYVAAVRDVDLTRERGETEMLKVGSVVKRDLLAAAALEGVFLGHPTPPPHRQWAGPPPHVRLPLWPFALAPGDSGTVNLNPPGPTFPVPMPYPRPHP